MFYAINGYIFGNLPGLTMRAGGQSPLVPDGHGQRERHPYSPLAWQNRHRRQANTDVIELLPASMAVDMVADTVHGYFIAKWPITWKME